MEPGDLVVYTGHGRIPRPLLGMVLSEDRTITGPDPDSDLRYFDVFLVDGRRKLICEFYLRRA